MNPAKTGAKRCAIYTRKSTEEGLEQEFNTLDAQRDAGEAYIASQQHEGWVCLPERYDDGGFSGANTERPALQRLLGDIERGRVDAVVIYKVDRLSRSLLDFAKLMEVFDRHEVAFVSVTQQFNTATSMGRLILNVLLSFAQFEREMIAERTRDKIAAARKKGRWSGGMPPLGYEVAPGGGKLVVHAEEAAQVREIFRLYVREQSLLTTAQELNRRGWRTKQWTTKKGRRRGGVLWDKSRVHRILTSVVYLGQVTYKGTAYDGVHEPLIDAATFERARALLEEGRVAGSSALRNRHGFLLRGMLRCGACATGMSASWTTRRGKVYRYYRCDATVRRGAGACPVGAISAEAIEQFIVARVRDAATSPEVIEQALSQVAEDRAERRDALAREEQQIGAAYRRCREEAGNLLDALAQPGASAGRFAPERLGELKTQAAQLQARRAEVRGELATLQGANVGMQEVRAALALFEPVWDVLGATERARIVRLLLEEVRYDGAGGEVTLSFYPLGIRQLAEEAAEAKADEAAP
ncbi:recombinase family protein [Haliangium ochraceum]|uniref:Resolvase domain protein n=1 Tax=Haliangium ochraceum (strain DSM 14365 / JCM 11303 / SMP-2) TaxID=502025 RepID=D0LNE7_HALO1|nr:recombinase family protein [Haliangium ochraceum]ACY15324.1 Resolvase domain protein [Haliangium ochraceum DSM 14365]